MAGASYIIDDREVRTALVALRRDRRPLLEEWGAILVASTQRRFAISTAPDGAPWRPLAPATLRARAGRSSGARRRRIMAGARPLIWRGHLRRSITYALGRDVVMVGTNRVYGAIHQFGGRAGRGLKSVIPARPYLGVSAADAVAMRRAALRFLGRGVGDA